jgi:hypothetical protein
VCGSTRSRAGDAGAATDDEGGLGSPLRVPPEPHPIMPSGKIACGEKDVEGYQKANVACG